MRRFGVGIACVAVVILLAWAWRGLQVHGLARIQPAVVGSAATSTTSTSQHEVLAEPDRILDRDATRTSPVVERRQFTAIGRCIDEDDAPLPGLSVTLSKYRWKATADSRVIVAGRDRPVASAMSDASGGFVLTFDAPDGQIVALTVDCRPHDRVPLWRWVDVADGVTHVDLGDLRLERSVTLVGHVRDEDGAPMSGALVNAMVFSPAFGFQYHHERVPTDANGSFRIGGVPSGLLRLQARLEDQRTTLGAPFEVRAGALVEGLELVIPRLDTELVIAGLVVDVDGTPLAGSTVTGTYREADGAIGMLWSGRTDAHGRFLLSGRAGATYELSATHPQGSARPALAAGVPPGTRDLVLRLQPRAKCQLIVRDGSGDPVLRFGLRTTSSTGSSTWTGANEAETDRPDGRATLEEDARGPFTVWIDAKGFETTAFGPFEPDTPLVEAVLRRLPALRGRVTVRGAPLAAARVVALVALEEGERAKNSTFDLCAVANAYAPETTTDASGEFMLPLATPGRWHARATSAGHPSGLSQVVVVATGEAVPGLTLELGPRGAIEGRVREELGAALAQVLIGASCGDGAVQTAVSGDDGRFRLEDLAPGEWQLRALPAGWKPSNLDSLTISRQGEEIRWDCTVRDGTTTSFDVVVPRRAVVRVEFAPALAAYGPWRLRAERKGSYESIGATEDRGVVTLDLPSSGRWWLCAEREDEAWSLDIRQEIDVPAGDSRHEFQLTVGGVRGALRDPLPKETTIVLEFTGPSLSVTGRARRSATGAFAFPIAPQGDVSLRVEQRDMKPASVRVLADRVNDAGEL